MTVTGRRRRSFPRTTARRRTVRGLWEQRRVLLRRPRHGRPVLAPSGGRPALRHVRGANSVMGMPDTEASGNFTVRPMTVTEHIVAEGLDQRVRAPRASARCTCRGNGAPALIGRTGEVSGCFGISMPITEFALLARENWSVGAGLSSSCSHGPRTVLRRNCRLRKDRLRLPGSVIYR